jgi:signal transduction histidine kinase
VSPSFARRLVLVSTLALAGVFTALIAATALFAFSLYVGALKAQVGDEVADVRAYVVVNGAPADAKALGEAIAQRFFHPDLLVSVLDAQHRVQVRQRSVTSSRLRLSNVAIDVQPRSRVVPDSTATRPVARVSFALATLFGLGIRRTEFPGGIDLIVRAGEPAVVDVVERFAPGFLLAELLACIIAFALARLLTREALRPLVAVNAALERFAAGDLTPQLVSADGRGDLGALAVTYNAAVAQMELAFAERERAEAAMHQFISDAGHQLKTPLTVIRGFISVLRKGELRDAQDYDRILEKMSRQSVLMGGLIEKLILLERWERDDEGTQPTVIDVAQLVEDVVMPLAEAQPARAISLDIAPGASAAVDPSDFAHAVTNLVDNAIKYTRGAVCVRVARADGQVIVEVADEGPGMTRDELGHAFDRFYRGATRREIDGSGLGLAIAKRAVERAGGSIEARSEPGGGSRFTIVLPVHWAA